MSGPHSKAKLELHYPTVQGQRFCRHEILKSTTDTAMSALAFLPRTMDLRRVGQLQFTGDDRSVDWVLSMNDFSGGPIGVPSYVECALPPQFCAQLHDVEWGEHADCWMNKTCISQRDPRAWTDGGELLTPPRSFPFFLNKINSLPEN